MSYVIISAATKGSRYVECLELQRDKHGDRFMGFVLKDRGSWSNNTKIKPEAVRKAFENGAEAVLWIDADCDVSAPIGLPEGNWDVGVIDNIHPEHVNKISAGFLLFRKTDATEKFLRTWEQNMRHRTTDHGALTMTVKKAHLLGVEVKNVSKWLQGRHAINVFAPERGVVQ